MKEKLLWLLKGMGLSIGLFIFWRPVSEVYGFLLKLLVGQSPVLDSILKMNESIPYIESLILIPFIALTIATPVISISKKAVTMGILASAVLSLNAVAILFMKDIIHNNPYALVAYTSFQMLVPFLIWTTMCFPYVSGQNTAESASSLYSCPICKSEYADIMGHIQEIHGEKSLRLRKVKRFVLKNPEIAS